MSDPVFQPPPTHAEVITKDASQMWRFNPVWLKWFIELVNFIDNSGGGTGGVVHNSTSGLQGGATGEYYHLTAQEHSWVADTPAAPTTKFWRGDHTWSDTLAGPFQATDITATGNLSIQGNTTLGNAIGDTVTITGSTLTLSNAVTVTGTWANLGIVTTADINGGTVDGVVIGGAVAAAGTFTTLNASSGGALTGTWTNLGSVTTIDINGGTVDGTVIGGAVAAAGTFTTLNATGGGALTGTWSDLGSVTTVDINGGTVDGTIIGGATPAAGTFTNLASTGTTTIGDASGDTLTLNAAAWTLANNTTMTRAFAAATGTMIGLTYNLTATGGASSPVRTGLHTELTININGATASGTTTGTHAVATAAGTATVATAVGASGTVRITSASGLITAGDAFRAVTPGIQAGGVITTYSAFHALAIVNTGIGTAYGFAVDASGSAGTLTAGFRGAIAAAATRWNLYMDGTAQNAMAGNLRIGSVVAPTVALDVTGAALISTTLGVGTNLSVDGNTVLGNSSADTITFTGRMSSDITWTTDNANDIGASGANRPRDLYLARNAVIDGTLTGPTNLTAWAAWSPTRTGWTDVGAPTVTGRYCRIRNVVFFQIKVVPNVTVATVGGTSYTDLPVAAAAAGSGGDGSMMDQTTLLSVGQIVIDYANSRCYVPSQAATADTVTVTGWYEV